MGIPTLIATNTEDDDATSSFTSGIDSTYDEYMFVFTDCNPATNDRHFSFQCSTDGGSNYNVTMTTTYIRVEHSEDGSGGSVSYNTSRDQAQGTDFQNLADSVGSGADESCAGILHLFSPASTTYVKHFYSRSSTMSSGPQSTSALVAGYFNTTSAINAIQFKFTGGTQNFDGVIQMYGIS